MPPTTTAFVESGLSRNAIITNPTHSPHGELNQYTAIAQAALTEDPEFYAHLIAWNARKGSIRDARVALPVLALSKGPTDPDFQANALAHMAQLDPRNLVRAVRFGKQVKTPSHGALIRWTVQQKLQRLESKPRDWTRVALQHRQSLKELYALLHIKPGALAQSVLFDKVYAKGSPFEAIAKLTGMTPTVQATAITKHRIPFLVAQSVLGAKAREPKLLMAIIKRMSPTELVTNMQRLEKLGIKDHSITRAALEAKLADVAKSGANVLKTAKAVAGVTNKATKARLQATQEKQIKAQSVEGDWLVLADRSPSMEQAVDAARFIAASLAKFTKGQVHLVFFDSTVHRVIDATGMDYDQLIAETGRITAGGNGTWIGTGVDYAAKSGWSADGVVVVSDGIENRYPQFHECFSKFQEAQGKELPLYWFRLETPHYGSDAGFLGQLPYEEFDLRGQKVDEYSIPNLVQTMRSNPYALADEILATPLLTLTEVLGVAV